MDPILPEDSNQSVDDILQAAFGNVQGPLLEGAFSPENPETNVHHPLAPSTVSGELAGLFASSSTLDELPEQQKVLAIRDMALNLAAQHPKINYGNAGFEEELLDVGAFFVRFFVCLQDGMEKGRSLTFAVGSFGTGIEVQEKTEFFSVKGLKGQDVEDAFKEAEAWISD
uniref:Uncharacterized protein n=1 Tax=Chromera velia CCMP2878 TaxID=1169474 RepID=A0A0G4GAC0_9ALVE|eukprot:Cvel_20889.t1-p1 / transcript=Cvel_20889.t1 / gene=Cvel_20889 / organism=Chromera_velia_CCMP2878 / gene_product=hypothetical protein / transcript_product=hypothetical protein / location=Cvel_scaffold1915:22684-23190(+) / protein_length=169 / sequence_SO=supercontig / SO=protein_coding / is_pseudo=false